MKGAIVSRCKSRLEIPRTSGAGQVRGHMGPLGYKHSVREVAYSALHSAAQGNADG